MWWLAHISAAFAAPVISDVWNCVGLAERLNLAKVERSLPETSTLGTSANSFLLSPRQPYTITDYLVGKVSPFCPPLVLVWFASRCSNEHHGGVILGAESRDCVRGRTPMYSVKPRRWCLFIPDLSVGGTGTQSHTAGLFCHLTAFLIGVRSASDGLNPS